MPDPAAFLEDVLAEPETLAGLLDAYAAQAGPLAELGDVRGHRVLFVGMGSSRFAALAACPILRAAGIDATVERASTRLATPPRPDLLVVAVSAGGRTPETVAAAERHRGAGVVVAVTNDPGGALAGAADVVLPLLAGEERGGIACKTYQATVAVLLLLCGRVLGSGPAAGDLRRAVEAAASVRDGRAGWLQPALDVLGGGPLHCIAPAERLSSAEQAALMLREGPRVPAFAAETGDWLHVDVYLSKRPGYRAILFPGSRYDGEVLDWLERRGCASVAVGGPEPRATLQVAYPGAGESLVDLLVETSVVELLAAELAARQAG
ncbi:MAG: SIS domain-containing protein [Thermoleophilia bacterium]|nr:SIS domain-containing protein [Thermoleophilia bacterium]